MSRKSGSEVSAFSVLKGSITLFLLAVSLGYFIYCRVTGFSPVKMPAVEELRAMSPIMIPLVYTFAYVVKAGAALVFAFITAGIIAECFPKQKVLKYLSSGKWYSYLLAAGSAPLLTVCSCVMIPIFAGLLYAGAGLGPALALLLAAPAGNVMAIIFTAGVVSPKIALYRLAFSIIAAVLIGAAVAKTPWGREVEKRFRARVSAAASTEAYTPPIWDRLWASLITAGSLGKKVLPYLLAGVAVVSYFQAYVPPELVATYLTGVRGILLGSVIGVPAYTPTLVEVVLVNALKDMGAAPYAALAFLIGGPMTSIPSMSAASRIVGVKVVLTYALMAIAAGIIAGWAYMVIEGPAW